MPTTLDSGYEITAHTGREAMVLTLTQQICRALMRALNVRGRASLAVSGGSTPKPLYEALSREPLDWEKVTIILVDERWVDPGQPGSNEDFVRSALLQNEAANARFIGLKNSAQSPAEGLEERLAALPEDLLPLDVAVLGMGNDGHTASWFPEAEGLAGALDLSAPPLAAITAHQSAVTGDHLERITLTLPVIANAGMNLLMITGPEKQRALEMVRIDGPVERMPVRALLRASRINLQIHWSL